MITSLSDNAIVVDPRTDNVAVCKATLPEGVNLQIGSRAVNLKQTLRPGDHIAVCDIPPGKLLVQYGHAFGISNGISAGDLITSSNAREITIDVNAGISCRPPAAMLNPKVAAMTFQGYRRADGRVGTRNYYLVVPTSLCASQTASRIAITATTAMQGSKELAALDGIAAIPHTEGCGCASNHQIDRLLLVLKNYMSHPNVGGVLVIDLGCEQTNYRKVYNYLHENHGLPSIPCDWLTIQTEGGTGPTIEKGTAIIQKRISEAARITRTACQIADLVVGAECGASDAFSGITANPLIGNVVDKIIAGGGSAIIDEVTEMIGAEHILMNRMRNQDVVEKFRKVMNRYRDLAQKLNVNMNDNLVEENKAGGLVNSCLKSLGAIMKGGSTAIEDVLEYGEGIKRHGLCVMEGPGNDMESVTGLVASGATVVLFSTGRGAISGNAIVPVIKVSSNTGLYRRMPGDMDFDAGTLLAPGHLSLDALGNTMLGLLLAVADGQASKAELNHQNQFQVWTAGKLSL